MWCNDVVTITQLFDSGGDATSMIFNVIWMIVFFVFILFFNQRMQIMTYQRNVEKAVNRLQVMSDKSREDIFKTVKPFTADNADIRTSVNNYLEFFTIEPVSLDPFGVLGRLEHILDVRRERSMLFVSQIAPKADRHQKANIEDVIESATAVNYIYKVVRHYLLLGKKTKSLMIFVQLDMQLPMIMKQADAYYAAQKTFAAAKPIGDGLGPLVAAKFMVGSQKEPIAEEVVYSQVDVLGRKLYVLKAEGPGGVVGKPGEGVKQLIERLGGKVSRVIMIDAGLKLEGEKTGEVVDGVGAAIGDPGPEKFKIEDACVKYKIPLDAIICKMSLEDALTTIKKEIVESSDIVYERVMQAIKERTKEGDAIIVAGIGNTMAVGQ